MQQARNGGYYDSRMIFTPLTVLGFAECGAVTLRFTTLVNVMFKRQILQNDC